MSGNSSDLIVALDFEDAPRALKLVETLEGLVDSYKVGAALFARSGTEVIRTLHQQKKRIIVDLKLLDTPRIVSEALLQLAEQGVHYATVHCLGGRRMLEAANQACRGSDLRLLGVTLLSTHPTHSPDDWIFPQSPEDMVARLTELAAATRLAGVFCSPQELQRLRPSVHAGFVLASAGIRLPNQTVFQDDQERVASPQEAVEWGADWIVLGRPILQSPEPRRVVESVLAATA